VAEIGLVVVDRGGVPHPAAGAAAAHFLSHDSPRLVAAPLCD
jgi:hypothetical protein